MKTMDTVTPASGAKFTGKIVSFVDFWLGQQLRAIRREQSLSLEQVARKADISIGSLSQIERGMTSPTVNMLNRISGALNISLGELLSNIECTDEQTDCQGRLAQAGGDERQEDHQKNYHAFALSLGGFVSGHYPARRQFRR